MQPHTEAGGPGLKRHGTHGKGWASGTGDVPVSQYPNGQSLAILDMKGGHFLCPRAGRSEGH